MENTTQNPQVEETNTGTTQNPIEAPTVPSHEETGLYNTRNDADFAVICDFFNKAANIRIMIYMERYFIQTKVSNILDTYEQLEDVVQYQNAPSLGIEKDGYESLEAAMEAVEKMLVPAVYIDLPNMTPKDLDRKKYVAFELQARKEVERHGITYNRDPADIEKSHAEYLAKVHGTDWLEKLNDAEPHIENNSSNA